MLEGLRGEDSIAELCRKEGINQNLYYLVIARTAPIFSGSVSLHGSDDAGRICRTGRRPRIIGQ